VSLVDFTHSALAEERAEFVLAELCARAEHLGW
jgi:hypothetical protein